MSLHRVVEVREGQKTEMFDKFPYEQVENQSFSLVYPHEGIQLRVSFDYPAINAFCGFVGKRYAYLSSLNLICGDPVSYNLWINAV